MCHNDVTPQNVVVRDGRAVGLIDFDLAGPTTRLIDVYTTALHYPPLREPADIWPTWTGLDQPGRLRVLADAYGLIDSQRLSLIDLGVLRADRSWLLMNGAAEHLGGGWARMWHDGVGELIRRRQAWLTTNRGSFLAALSSHSVRHGAPIGGVVRRTPPRAVRSDAPRCHLQECRSARFLAVPASVFACPHRLVGGAALLGELCTRPSGQA